MNPEPSTSSTSDETAGTAISDPRLKIAAEPSSIFRQGKEKDGTMTSHVEDPFAHLLPVKYFPVGHPSREAYLEEWMKAIHRPRPKYYGIALDTDMKKMKRGRCKYEFFKEEAISFLEGIGGSLWSEKFVAQYKVAVGNVFICSLLEDELNIVKGKSEVLGVRRVSEENRFDRSFFEPDLSPPEQFGYGWRRDPFSYFQAC